VLDRERRGDYLGKTVQVVPHITDAIQDWIQRVAHIPVDGRDGVPGEQQLLKRSAFVPVFAGCCAQSCESVHVYVSTFLLLAGMECHVSSSCKVAVSGTCAAHLCTFVVIVCMVRCLCSLQIGFCYG
jgi:hypothetical protein